MPATLRTLTKLRFGVALSVLAYLREEAARAAMLLPAYFPERLRGRDERETGFDVLRQRVRLTNPRVRDEEPQPNTDAHTSRTSYHSARKRHPQPGSVGVLGGPSQAGGYPR